MENQQSCAVEPQKVTIVMIGMLGYSVIEATLLEHGRKKYAQYEKAAYMRWRPKGSRRRTSSVLEGHAPFFIALAGWGLGVRPCQQWIEIDERSRRGKYSGFDERWRIEMNQAVDEAIARGAEVVGDYRCPINEEYLARCIARGE